MAAGDVLGTRPCGRCDGTLTYREGKSGAVSGACSGCKRQTFDRTPRAVEGLRKLFAAPAESTGRPAEKKKGGFLDEL